MSDSSAPFGQAKYQVRFDWGAAGAERILPGAHVAVVVDVLSFTTAVVAAAERGVPVAPWPAGDAAGAAALARRLGGVVAGRRGEPGPSLSPTSFAGAEAFDELDGPVVIPSPNGGAIAAGLAERGLVVLAGALRNRTAVAEWILALQSERGERTIVAIVAAGERVTSASEAIRFAIEDQLAAGAIVDALVGLGIDHTSPEAAVACAAFEGLRHATTHLIGASGSAVELVEGGFRGDVRFASERDASRVVPELRDGVFRA
ncbi:2-phosphosulfolactate phosphatase [Agromyces ramosus]|uniref:Probable 2-phosphosulfolactate phosphatase n=1 Tax=Agromyces ramosus TaxID=33879 RepID=A0A4Q7MBT3_9MICO|nr:2-phosphosulfolactate phosphatase [Agromyces ramosus]RZS64298.1 2-phosphosulfolactate phosphatase [Agromyces ramosus]